MYGSKLSEYWSVDQLGKMFINFKTLIMAKYRKGRSFDRNRGFRRNRKRNGKGGRRMQKQYSLVQRGGQRL